jgi:glycosyltransferase involved in cell wall biosynthesis
MCNGHSMRVLFLTIGPDSEPSSRFRVFQFLDPLRRAGIQATVLPLADHRYLELGYGIRRPAAVIRIPWVTAHFLGRILRRLRDLWRARSYDLVFIQKETFPFGMERLISLLGIPAIYDFDDAVHVQSHLADGRGGRLRGLADRVLRRDRSLPALLAQCRAVIAGSPLLASYASQHCKSVEVIPTVVDTDAYTRVPLRRQGTLTVGWIGAPPNQSYLEPLRPVFQELATRFDLRLRILGTESFDCPGVAVECGGWRHYASVADEVTDLRGFDVGIMPLPDTEFAAGKCAFKAIQYMASGIPVVASPVGVNAQVVVDGECGFLATTPAEWLDRLTELLGDAELRDRLGEAGRRRARSHYSIRSAVPKLVKVLESAASQAQGKSSGDVVEY